MLKINIIINNEKLTENKRYIIINYIIYRDLGERIKSNYVYKSMLEMNITTLL